MAQQPGQVQQSNSLDRRRQYFQQLLSGTTTPIGIGQKQIFGGQNDSDLFGLASLLGGQFGRENQYSSQLYNQYDTYNSGFSRLA